MCIDFGIVWPWDYHISPAEQWEFWALGDVNIDGKINEKDLHIIIDAMGTVNPNCDLNRDGTVDNIDLDICQANQGMNIWDYFGVRHPTPDWLVFGAIGGLAFIAGGIILVKRKKGGAKLLQ